MKLPDFLRRWFAARPQEAAECAAELAATTQCDGWWSGPAACSMCGTTWHAVEAIEPSQSEPIVPLECPWCHSMTGGPQE